MTTSTISYIAIREPTLDKALQTLINRVHEFSYVWDITFEMHDGQWYITVYGEAA